MTLAIFAAALLSVVGISFGVIIFRYWLNSQVDDFQGLDQVSEVGDLIGGVTGPVFAFVGALLVYVAFRQGQRELSLMAQEIQTNQDQVKEQADSLARQNYENGLFSLLDVYNRRSKQLAVSLTKLYDNLQKSFYIRAIASCNDGFFSHQVEIVRITNKKVYYNIHETIQGDDREYHRTSGEYTVDRLELLSHVNTSIEHPRLLDHAFQNAKGYNAQSELALSCLLEINRYENRQHVDGGVRVYNFVTNAKEKTLLYYFALLRAHIIKPNNVESITERIGVSPYLILNETHTRSGFVERVRIYLSQYERNLS